jgi:hypothetical protein
VVFVAGSASMEQRLYEQALYLLSPAATSFNRTFGEVYGLFTTLAGVSSIELVRKDLFFGSASWALANERTQTFVGFKSRAVHWCAHVKPHLMKLARAYAHLTL